MNRVWAAALSSWAAIGLSAGVSSAAPACPARADLQGVARLGAIEVTAAAAASQPVQIVRAGRKIAGKSCAALQKDDQVQTDSRTSVAVEFPDGIVVLMPNSSVRVASIWTFLGEIFSFGRVKVQDGYVTAAAEGTSYVLRTTAKGSELTVLEGHVVVTPKTRGAAPHRLEAGQVIAVAPGSAPIATRIPPQQVAERLEALKRLTGYGDGELAALEKRYQSSARGQSSSQPTEPAPAPAASSPATATASTPQRPSPPAPARPPRPAPAPKPSAPPPESSPKPAAPASPRPDLPIAANPSGQTFIYGAAAPPRLPVPSPWSIGASPPTSAPPSRDSVFLLFEGMGSLQSGGFALGSASFQGAWSRRFGASFGIRALSGFGIGRHRSPMFDPDVPGREEEAGEGTARLPFIGYHAELDAELHLSLADALDGVAGVGLRAGFTRLSDVNDRATHLVLGPTAGYRFEYLFAPPFRGVFGLHASFQRTPVAACPIGCEAPAEPRPSTWQLWLGLLLGVGVDL